MSASGPATRPVNIETILGSNGAQARAGRVESLILTLDPKYPGGVVTMQRAVMAAQRRMGLAPRLGFARMGGMDRWDLSIREEEGESPSISTGYLPTIEYLNYLVPALRLGRSLRRFPVVHVVSGVHSAALIPIVARHPFVSWIATPFVDEIMSRYGGDQSTLSIRVNHGLRGLNQRLERWTFKHARFVFALSTYTARRLIDVAAIDPRRLSILRCPVDLVRLRPREPFEARSPERPTRYLLSAGRVDDPRKNVPSLIRAYAPIAASFPDLDLVLAGKSQDSDNHVTRLAQSLGLSHRVHFPGHREGDELAALYRGAEGFVMTSRQEGLGIAVVEAQASGLPAIVMRCGGSDELIDTGAGDNRNGWLIEQGDEEGFTQALRELASDGEMRARFGAAARRRAERDYSFDLFTSRLREVYVEVFREAASGLT
jgi:glycosyltransferase involved in cell wall biosynthesis